MGKKHLIALFFSFQLFIAYSQSASWNEIQIDPRQYVTVNYRKTPTQGKLDTIWNWEPRRNVPQQKLHFLDIDGEIKIDFSKSSLISNRDFEGTISLEAEISGGSGTRKIEVNPYSEIGVQRIPIGVKSEPPSEIAKKLLNMLRELQDAAKTYDDIYFIRYYPDEAPLREDLFNKLNEIDRRSKETSVELRHLIEDGIQLRTFIRSFNYLDSSMYLFTNITAVRQFQNIIQGIREDFQSKEREDRKRYIIAYKNALAYVNSKTGIVLDYLNSFEAAGEDATKAFLSLVNKDLIGYRTLKTGLINRQNRLNGVDILNFSENDRRLDTVLFRNGDLILDCGKNLSDLSRFKNSPLERIMTDYVNRIGISIENENYPMYTTQEEKERLFYKKILDNFLDDISDEVSIQAGRIIYKKLVYATIDLGKSGAKNGEVLNVYVTWILDSKRDSLANSPRLPIGKYYLRETGWRFEVADMFALIKRINESNVDQTKVSPSNFKGSGGAVLMWTFNKEDRGMTIKEIAKDFFSVKKKNRLMNFFEPSIGINVSYLDFSTDKDVEIGTGLQLGLFRNKIFFGYGINLHMLSPKKQEPNYFYVGFSFAQLSDLFKNSNSITIKQ